jgi:import inner membrane translocase subunit TIM54
MIFLTVVATWTGAVVYDRREKKRIQKKWCDMVSPLAKEHLPPTGLQRKLTVYLSAPPADGLLTSREHFHEYVKPILYSAGLDWDAVEGRKEGDVRAGTAEAIRKLRKMKGEQSNEPLPEDDLELLYAEIHQRSGVKKFDGPAGDIVIGRNTWKEYIRGLHEGWLGPIDAPKIVEETDQDATTPPEDNPSETPEQSHSERPHDIASIPNFAAEQVLSHLPHHGKPKSELTTEEMHSSATVILDDVSPSAILTSEDETKSEETKSEETKSAETKKDEAKADEKPKKPRQPPPFISTSEYSSATPPLSLPQELAPSTVIPVPHILGFLNTHIRIYRYLTKRYLAEEIGQQVAATCFAAYAPYERVEDYSTSSPFPSDSASPAVGFTSEESAESDNAEAAQSKYPSQHE